MQSPSRLRRRGDSIRETLRMNAVRRFRKWKPVLWKPLSLPFGLSVLVGICFGLGLPLLSFRLDMFGSRESWIGINTAMEYAPAAIVGPLVPLMLMRWTAKWLSIGTIAISALAIVLLSQTEAVAHWMALRLSIGVTITVLFVLIETWINATAPDRIRGLVLGAYATIEFLSFAVGPLLCRVVGHEGTFPFVVAALILVAALPLAARVPELSDTGRADGKVGEQPPWQFFSGFRHWPLPTLAVLAFGGFEAASITFLPLWLASDGTTPGNAALLISAYAIGGMVFQVPIGALCDRLSPRTLLLGISLPVVGISLIIPLLVGIPTLLLVACGIAGGLAPGIYTVAMTQIGRQLRAKALATAQAGLIAAYGLGATVYLPLVGIVMEYAPRWGIAGMLAAVMLGVAILAIGKPSGGA